MSNYQTILLNFNDIFCKLSVFKFDNKNNPKIRYLIEKAIEYYSMQNKLYEKIMLARSREFYNIKNIHDISFILEHFSKNYVFLFHCQEKLIQSIVLKSVLPETDFMQKEGLQWLSENMFTDLVEIHIGKKEYEQERNIALFDLISQGAILSDGQLYLQINGIIQR
jgi:hypothetical protein